MNKTKKAAIILSAVLGVTYLGLISKAASGYGYAGHNGYSSGPSFFYWGGPMIYSNRSARSGSIGGSSVRGGGPGSGK